MNKVYLKSETIYKLQTINSIVNKQIIEDFIEAKLASTEEIKKYLKENENLILTDLNDLNDGNIIFRSNNETKIVKYNTMNIHDIEYNCFVVLIH